MKERRVAHENLGSQPRDRIPSGGPVRSGADLRPQPAFLFAAPRDLLIADRISSSLEASHEYSRLRKQGAVFEQLTRNGFDEHYLCSADLAGRTGSFPSGAVSDNLSL
ncbi:hypothetical protein KM043_016839 [Ampulex compressa]|nr:hypothetical protein KM043_016839 [Ampulex compressa]